MGKLKELALGEGVVAWTPAICSLVGTWRSYAPFSLRGWGCSINGISDIQTHLNGVWFAVEWLHVVEPALSRPWVRAGRGGMGRAMWAEAASPLWPLLPHCCMAHSKL